MNAVEPKVKGSLFRNVGSYVKRNIGDDGLRRVGTDPDGYEPERWYPYHDFCRLLDIVQRVLAGHKNATPFMQGFESVYGDQKWHAMFRDKDLKDVFGTNVRQDTQYMVGRFDIQPMKEGSVTVKMSLWSSDKEDNEIWAQFYHGIMRGVLETTGKQAEVFMEKAQENGRAVWTYQIVWQPV